MSGTIEVLCNAQDALLERLLTGQLNARNLGIAYREHIRTLVGAGYKPHEAQDCFWDAVHTARLTRSLEAAQGGAV